MQHDELLCGKDKLGITLLMLAAQANSLPIVTSLL